SAWERHVLPARVVNYNPQWLDDLCLAGDVAWARLSLRKPANGNGRSSTPSRATPISIVLRRDFGSLLEAVRSSDLADPPSAGARSARRHARNGSARPARGSAPQGRWSLVHRFQRDASPTDELAEQLAMQLLARYGVVFRDLVARENFALPWRDIVRALRRQE